MRIGGDNVHGSTTRTTALDEMSRRCRKAGKREIPGNKHPRSGDKSTRFGSTKGVFDNKNALSITPAESVGFRPAKIHFFRENPCSLPAVRGDSGQSIPRVNYLLSQVELAPWCGLVFRD
jgi:hypothetical protein